MFQINFAIDTLTIFSPNYFGEQENTYDNIHFLEDEHLSFKLCLNKLSKDIETNLICSDKSVELELFPMDDNGCYFSNYEIKNLDCSEFNLEISYNLNDKLKKIKRSFEKEKESLLINHILEKNYDEISITDASYNLLVLNDIQNKENKENSEIYDYLKSNRNNDDKCWPSSSCDISETLKILRNLKDSDYDLTSRMLEDGKIYLERNIIKNIKPDDNIYDINVYEFEILSSNEFDSNENIDCDLDIDYGDEEKSYSYDENSDRGDMMIQKSSEENIDFRCDDTMDLMELKIFEEKLGTRDYTNEDSVTFTLSSSDIDDFDEITYLLEIENNFTESGEIDCEIEIDGDSKSYTFDKYSTKDELIFKDLFSDELNLDCDENLDIINLDVYGNLEDEIEYINKDSFDYDLDIVDNDQLYEFKIDFKYDFAYNEEISCDLDIDSKTTRTYTFDDNDNLDDLVIDGKKAKDKISFSCDVKLEELNFELYDIFSRAQVFYEAEDVNSYSYTIPSTFSDYSCIGENDYCNFEDSLNALIIYGSELEDADKIETYVDSFIQKDDNQFFISTDNRFMDTGKYLEYKSNDDLIDFMKYSQNNDGSWNSDIYNAEVNFYSTLGLLNTAENSEYLDDAQKWIYFNEPINGWNSIEKNSIAYLAIKEKLKPYININSINELSENINFEIFNPTIYNLNDLKVTFDSNIAKYIKVAENLGDLESLSSINLNISVIDNFVGEKSGFMKIEGIDGKDNELELLYLPLILKGPTPFTLVEKNYSISKSQSDVYLSIEKNLDQFSAECYLINPLTENRENYTLTEMDSEIKLLNPESKSGKFNVKLNCDYDGVKFSSDLELNVIESIESFDVSENSILIKSKDDFSINVHSMLDEKQTLSFRVEGDLKDVILITESSKIIAANDSRDIYFSIADLNSLETFKRTTNSKIIITSDTGFSKSIDVFVNLNAGGVSDGSNWWIYLIIIFTIIFLIIILMRRHRELNNDEMDMDYDHPNDEEEMYFE